MLPITPTIIRVWRIGIFSSNIENLLLLINLKRDAPLPLTNNAFGIKNQRHCLVVEKWTSLDKGRENLKLVVYKADTDEGQNQAWK
jgi:hypothetical protein